MTIVNVSLVKELRALTNAGIMDCKKALVEAHGDIDLAIEKMRISGVIKAAKKASNSVSHGIIMSKIDGDYGILLEINCQTDFLIKEKSFLTFAHRVLDTAIADKITNIDELKEKFENERVILVNKSNENIAIRRIVALEGNTIESYQHGTRIGVLIATKTGNNKELIKQLAMHIAASKPEFIRSEDISTEVLKKERQVQLDIATKSGKSKKIVEKIIENCMDKFISEIALDKQPFIFNPNKTVDDLLKEYSINIIDFARFEVGENIKTSISHKFA